MSEAHRSGTHADDAASGLDRDAKIEQLLLLGLDHYFAASFELAINVWTRALFLDRSHARARAYIERARSALAERQRESEELLQTGVAAFHRGEADEARRLLQAAIDCGAPSEEALDVLERLNRLETVNSPATSIRSGRLRRARVHRAARGAGPSIARRVAVAVMALSMLGLGAFGTLSWRDAGWDAAIALARRAANAISLGPMNPWSIDVPAAITVAPVARNLSLALPRRGETTLMRAKALVASGHLRDALAALESIRLTDAQKTDADRLRADIQHQLLAVTAVPALAAADREKGERRVP